MTSREIANLLREGTYFLVSVGAIAGIGSFIYLAGIPMEIFWSHTLCAILGGICALWLIKRDFLQWVVAEIFYQIDPPPPAEDTLIRFMRSPLLEEIPSTCSVQIIDGTGKEIATSISFTKAVEEGFREWKRLNFEYSVDIKK